MAGALLEASVAASIGASDGLEAHCPRSGAFVEDFYPEAASIDKIAINEDFRPEAANIEHIEIVCLQ